MPPKKAQKAPKAQPAWLHVPEERNPVLNPQAVDAEKLAKDEADRKESLDYLNKRSVGVPFKKQPPPPLLLDLIGAFLTEYGFGGAGRLYTTEREARSKIDGWENTMGRKFPKSLPSLVIIFKEFNAKWEKEQDLSTSSSEDSDESNQQEVVEKGKKSSPKIGKSQKQAVESSSSGSQQSSSEESDEDVDMKDAPVKTPIKSAKTVGRITKKSAKSSRSSSSSESSSAGSSLASSSDSDADDEKDVKPTKIASPKPKINGVQPKVSSSSDNNSSSATESSSDSDIAVKQTKIEIIPKTADPKAAKALKSAVETPLPASESSSSGSEEEEGDSSSGSGSVSGSGSEAESESKSESESDSNTSLKQLETKTLKEVPFPRLNGTLSSLRKNSTDSSNTINGDISKKGTAIKSSDSSSASASTDTSSTSGSESDSDAPPPKPAAATPISQAKRKRSPSSTSTPATKKLKAEDSTSKVVKAQNVPFSRIAPDTKVDPKLASNKYVPYDYAERAYRDLIVTKGKEFTKEKNKKKRGSYRGGTIDVNGRKGIKFDD